jgi:heptosyltransferase-2
LIITLCNGASGSQKKQKQWPHFAKLAKTIRYFYPEATIVKVGNGHELRGVTCDIDFVGKLTFTQSTHVLAYSDLMITSDTGLMHAGDAVGTPMVVIFGGTVLSKNAPLNGKAKIARADLSCQPCQYTDRFLTCDHVRCLHDLTVGQVFAHVRGYLHDTD